MVDVWALVIGLATIGGGIALYTYCTPIVTAIATLDTQRNEQSLADGGLSTWDTILIKGFAVLMIGLGGMLALFSVA